MKSHFLHFSHELYCTCVWHTASFGSGMKTASAAPFWHLHVPGGTARWRMQAVWWLDWSKLFAPARVRSSKDGPPAVTRACCLRAASQWRLAVVCILSKVVSKVLRSSAFGLCPCRSTGCAYGCHLLRAVRIGRMGICVHSTLWQQARIGMQPDVASGRCVQLRLCPTRLPRGHRKITRSNTKATSDLHSKEDQQIMQSHDNTAKAHIGAESSSARSSIAKRALQQAKALRRSDTTHFR